MPALLQDIVANLNTTAMVLGYPVLIVIVMILVWFGSRIFRDIGKIFNEARYDSRKRKYEELTWDNNESSWVLALDEEERGFPHIPEQRHPTLELPELTNLQEYRHERS